MSAPVSLSTPEPGERAVALVHPHMRALDGIRFIAAFCVLAGHGYGYVVLQPSIPATDPISTLLVSLPGLGMTLFFVLSGFVIHYNYHRTVGIGSSGNGDFFIARFSRLYPLFLAVFAIEFIHMLWLEGYLSGAPLDDFDLFGPLPFFLSFTQTWLFIPFDGPNITAGSAPTRRRRARCGRSRSRRCFIWSIRYSASGWCAGAENLSWHSRAPWPQSASPTMPGASIM
jgi:hypothetical protein